MTKSVVVPLPVQPGLLDLSDMKVPPIGGKCFLIQAKGLYVFERGPGTLRTMAITHAGSGSLVAYDGLPDERGAFIDNAEDSTQDARPLFKANPVVMGSWMLDAGFVNGLTVSVKGGHGDVPAFVTIVWYPFNRKK